MERGALTLSAGAITEHVLRRADRAGDGTALIDAADGTVTSWPRFARTVRAAAAGLGRRGVRQGDTVGVLVGDAASYAIAAHAVRAAGAAAAVLRPDRDAAGLAAELSRCRARMLIAAAPLAALTSRAADRSWVRQVVCFGEAEGTTPFSSLLEAVQLEAGPPDGGPGAVPGSGPRTEAPATGLAPGDVVIAAPPCGQGPAYGSLLDLVLLAGATLVAAPAPQIPAALHRYGGTAAIVPLGTHVPGLPADRVFTVP